MQASTAAPTVRYPLTSGQSSYYARVRERPEMSSSISAAYRIEGELDVARFAEAVARTVAQHDALRIGLCDEQADVPSQLVRPQPDNSALLSLQQVRSSSEAQFDRYVRLVHGKDLAEPWDLATEYPFRFRLLRRSPTVHAFLASFSHVAVDGRGMSLVLRDLWQNFEQDTAQPDGPSAPQRESFVSAAEQHAADASAKAAGFWRQRVAENRPSGEPAPARPDTAEQQGVTVRVTLSGAERKLLRERARTFGCTEFQLTMAALAYAVLTETATGDRVHVWLPVDARSPADFDTSGMFTVSLPVALPRTASLTEMTRQVREEVMAVAAYRQVDPATLTELQSSFRESDARRGWSVMATYFNRDQNPGERSARGIVARPGSYPADFQYLSRGVELDVVGGAASLRIALALDPAFSADGTADRLVDAFSAGLGGVHLAG
ncbi:condensation domain-containing protein [Streptomyces sp. NBC_00358]|uniref:condensation domain-containing protein n=1 Tax=Streptomyces sp. NBC_00358 TaxID=2975725 RepID=UPI002E2656DD